MSTEAWAVPFASSCSDIGVYHEVPITLDEPLGSRKVVNVGCGPDEPGCKKVLER